MKYRVLLTDDAVHDLEEIDDYISEHDSPQSADYLFNQIEELIPTLADFPDRGAFPKELLSLGIKEYREVFFKPYRIIYRVIGADVIAYMIADGRRDMQTLLQRRMLAS
jgi:toxin ParE1/3/4